MKRAEHGVHAIGRKQHGKAFRFQRGAKSQGLLYVRGLINGHERALLFFRLVLGHLFPYKCFLLPLAISTAARGRVEASTTAAGKRRKTAILIRCGRSRYRNRANGSLRAAMFA